MSSAKPRAGSLQWMEQRCIPEPNSGCWLWTSTVNRTGYGRFDCTTSGTRKLAHRQSWTIHRGPIPDGMWVLHKCDTPSCINPDHLFLGNNRDNMLDMIRKGRGGSSTMPKPGEANPHAKLTEAEVRAIRSDARPQCVIASDYGMSPAAISQIKNRTRWAHLE